MLTCHERKGGEKMNQIILWASDLLYPDFLEANFCDVVDKLHREKLFCKNNLSLYQNPITKNALLVDRANISKMNVRSGEVTLTYSVEDR